MKDTKLNSFLIGGVLAAIVASACCIGPLVFAALGLASAGLITQLESFRGIFSLITIGLLGIAFYSSYRKKDGQNCTADSYCAQPKSDVWRKRVLWGVTVIVLALLTFPYWSALNSSTYRNTSSLNDVVVKEYYIKGMTCAGCIVGVQNALKKAPGLGIVDEDVSVGKMLLRFKKSDYAATETDCRIAKIIEAATEYEVYMDKEHASKACE